MSWNKISEQLPDHLALRDVTISELMISMGVWDEYQECNERVSISIKGAEVEVVFPDGTPKRWMSDSLRRDVKQAIVDRNVESMFGDGQERDMLYSGMAYKGVDNMSDDELLCELEQVATWSHEVNTLNLAKLEKERSAC